MSQPCAHRWRVTASIVLALALLGLAPAAFAQEDASLDAPVASPEEAARAAVDMPEAADVEWVEVSPGGLTADEAARRAVATAPAVRRAEAAGTAARAQADLAASGFAPRFEITGSYTRINQVELPPFEFAGMSFDNPFPQILDLWALRGQVQIPVSDYFLTIWPAYDGAEGFARAAQAQADVERQQVAFRAREAFFNHARAHAGRLVAEQAVESLEATLRDVESLQTAGTASRADVAQVRARLASARAMVVQANGQVRVTERVLRRLLHLPPSAQIRFGVDPFTADVDAAPEESALIATAMDRRGEVEALRTVVAAREALVRAQIGGVFPHLALVGQLETSSPNQRIIPQTTDFYTTWAVGAAITWSPNDLAEGVHRIREAEAQVAQAREDLEQLEDGVAIEAAQAVAAHQAAAESIAAAREAVDATALALEDRRALLRAGMATSTEVMRAQLDYTRARLELASAYADLQVARAQIDRVAARSVPGAEEE